jgi:hypothetical protein
MITNRQRNIKQSANHSGNDLSQQKSLPIQIFVPHLGAIELWAQKREQPNLDQRVVARRHQHH